MFIARFSIGAALLLSGLTSVGAWADTSSDLKLIDIVPGSALKTTKPFKVVQTEGKRTSWTTKCWLNISAKPSFTMMPGDRAEIISVTVDRSLCDSEDGCEGPFVSISLSNWTRNENGEQKDIGSPIGTLQCTGHYFLNRSAENFTESDIVHTLDDAVAFENKQ